MSAILAVAPVAVARAQALNTNLKSPVQTGYLELVGTRTTPGMRTCRGLNTLRARVIAGINHDSGFLECFDIPGQLGAIFDSAPPSPGQLPRLQWPALAGPDERVPGYSALSMHWCGSDALLVGYDGGSNTLRCARYTPFIKAFRVSGLGASGPRLSTPTSDEIVAPRVHICPPGWAVAGLHLDADTFLCSLVIPPAPGLDVSPAGLALGARRIGTFVNIAWESQPFTDTVRATRKERIVTPPGSKVTFCSTGSAGQTLGLKDRFGRIVPVARGARGAVAVKGNPIEWNCGYVRRTINCPDGTNVVDVDSFVGDFVNLRCLARSPAPWTP